MSSQVYFAPYIKRKGKARRRKKNIFKTVEKEVFYSNPKLFFSFFWCIRGTKKKTSRGSATNHPRPIFPHPTSKKMVGFFFTLHFTRSWGKDFPCLKKCKSKVHEKVHVWTTPLFLLCSPSPPLHPISHLNSPTTVFFGGGGHLSLHTPTDRQFPKKKKRKTAFCGEEEKEEKEEEEEEEGEEEEEEEEEGEEEEKEEACAGWKRARLTSPLPSWIFFSRDPVVGLCTTGCFTRRASLKQKDNRVWFFVTGCFTLVVHPQRERRYQRDGFNWVFRLLCSSKKKRQYQQCEFQLGVSLVVFLCKKRP